MVIRKQCKSCDGDGWTEESYDLGGGECENGRVTCYVCKGRGYYEYEVYERRKQERKEVRK